jgi:3-oxoacyl-[acyl-carrier-protein] synthase-3
MNRKEIKSYFANLTIGAGAVAWSITSNEHAAQTLTKISAFSTSTDTSHNHLCEGDQSIGGMVMQTNSEELLHAGIDVAKKAWNKFLDITGWSSSSPELIVTHQVGRAHQHEIEKALGYNPSKSFNTYETLGNCGSVSLPISYTIACEKNPELINQKSALLGIGSGLSSLMLALNN